MNESTTPPAEQPRHPIRVVSARTGLTPSLLRAWERRYGVVEPGRSEGGQRLYSDAQVERLLLLKRVTDEGRAIRHVAELDTERLRELSEEDREARRELRPAPARGGADVTLDAAFRAVGEMDAPGLEALLRRAVVTLGARAFIDELVTPLLRGIGDRWRRGELRPAHEHVATGVVERVVTWMLEPARPGREAPVAVVGTLTGEEHALGALLAAAAASLEGWHVTFLGSDLPPDEIALAASELGARLVGVSLVNPVEADGMPAKVRTLLDGVPASATVVLGGTSAADVAGAVGDARVRVAGDLGTFRSLLLELAAE